MRLKKLLPTLLLCAPLALGACDGGVQTNANGEASTNVAPTAAATAAATPTPQA